MPISRFITDLDGLMAEFAAEAPSSGASYAKLRMAVARMNELQRQLDIAREKLGAILSMAEMKIIYNQVDLSGEEGPAGARFGLHPDCLTGEAAIDADHGDVFALGNRLDAICAKSEVGVAEVQDALSDLTDKTRAAFAREEALMLAHGYPRLAEHRQTHGRMQAYLEDMHGLAAQQPLTAAIKLEKFLGSWLVWHIQREDMDFVRASRGAS